MKISPRNRVYHLYESICHFRVPKNHTVKARLKKWSLIMMQIKLIFTTKVSHLASFWKRNFLELGNGLFHLPENDREGLKPVSKMTLKKLNTKFCLEYPVRKNRTTLTDVPLLLEIFRWNDQKSHVPFTFQPDFPESFCKW